MGCLNSNEGFEHWFGNIHLSGPCNRSCYFCIGQHMMALDPLNNLGGIAEDSLDAFIDECRQRGVSEINVTGTNTDPLLYADLPGLKARLSAAIPNLVFGIRTNGALAIARPELMDLFDKGSVTICSFEPEIYKKMMGQGKPPSIEALVARWPWLKVNVVLGPENVAQDILDTIDACSAAGVRRINVREPYGQPHIGDPFAARFEKNKDVLGMPSYLFGETEVTYWDVHFVHVESVNLYANGKVSITYPITKGHDDETGIVLSQDNFGESGRIREQWVYA